MKKRYVAYKICALRLIAAGLLILSASITFAATLSDVSINSSLGEPLKAEVVVEGINTEEAVAASARLITNTATTQIAQELALSLEKTSLNNYLIKISSAVPIQQTNSELLLELIWPSGQLSRQYSVLLQPKARRVLSPSATEASTLLTPQISSQNAPINNVPADWPENVTPIEAPSIIPQSWPPVPAEAQQLPPQSQVNATEVAQAPTTTVPAAMHSMPAAPTEPVAPIATPIHQATASETETSPQNTLATTRPSSLPPAHATAEFTDQDEIPADLSVVPSPDDVLPGPSTEYTHVTNHSTESPVPTSTLPAAATTEPAVTSDSSSEEVPGLLTPIDDELIPSFDQTTVSKKQRKSLTRESSLDYRSLTYPLSKNYPVIHGDTLSGIATLYATEYEGINAAQMMLALYQKNKKAFIDADPNLLKSDVNLNIPSPEEVKQVSVAQAAQFINDYSRLFSENRQRIAHNIPGQSVMQKPYAESSGKIGQENLPAQLPEATVTDNLKLSRPDQNTSITLPEDQIAQKKALSEAQSRIAELEKNLYDLQNLLTIKNQELDELAKRLEAPLKLNQSDKNPEAAPKNKEKLTDTLPLSTNNAESAKTDPTVSDSSSAAQQPNQANPPKNGKKKVGEVSNFLEQSKVLTSATLLFIVLLIFWLIRKQRALKRTHSSNTQKNTPPRSPLSPLSLNETLEKNNKEKMKEVETTPSSFAPVSSEPLSYSLATPSAQNNQTAQADTAHEFAQIVTEKASYEANPNNLASAKDLFQKELNDIDLNFADHQPHADQKEHHSELPSETQNNKTTAAATQEKTPDSRLHYAEVHLEIGDLAGASELLEQVVKTGNAEDKEKALKGLMKIYELTKSRDHR